VRQRRATKVRLGKLGSASGIVEEFAAHLDNERFVGLSVTPQHGIRAGSVPGPHKDPFDRILIAQAVEEDMILVTNEKIFDGYGVTRLW
jgi:PIN domain nuclease of toxin-antitoxin system